MHVAEDLKMTENLNKPSKLFTEVSEKWVIRLETVFLPLVTVAYF